MRAGSVDVRAVAASMLALILSACVAGGLSGFGSSNCRTVYVLSGGVVHPVNSCGGIPREGLMAQKSVALGGDDLAALLAAPKFEPDAYYTGVDAPEDKASLTTIVNDAVRDLMAMPETRDAGRVRARLKLAVDSASAFATEDREHAHMYLVLAWRAAGFTEETGLFSSDELALGVF